MSLTPDQRRTLARLCDLHRAGTLTVNVRARGCALPAGAVDAIMGAVSHAAADPCRPQFDELTGELWFRGELVREFRHSADCQRSILERFEAMRWFPVIPNPLPTGGNAGKRLNDAVRRLSRTCRPHLRFHTRGDGRVRWAPL